jgi:hypothetical protein
MQTPMQTAGRMWQPVDELLMPFSKSDVPVHVRTYAHAANERAVVVGELADQRADIGVTLPWIWERLEREVDDIDTLRVFTFIPLAMRPLRQHVSGHDIAGGDVLVRQVLPGQATGSVAQWLLADGPAVDVWHFSTYRHEHLRRRVRESREIRWALPGEGCPTVLSSTQHEAE